MRLPKMLTKTKRRLTLASSTLWPKNLFIATFIFCLGLVCPPKASAVDPVHYDVTADTYIKTMAPGYNYGSESEMELRYWCGESYVPGDNSTVCYHQWLVVRPDVSFIPPGATIESYTEGNKCMKAILMEVGRHYREQGPSIIPNFYSEIKNMNKSYEHDFARALYLAEGSPEWLKTRLTQVGCDLNPNR